MGYTNPEAFLKLNDLLNIKSPYANGKKRRQNRSQQRDFFQSRYKNLKSIWITLYLMLKIANKF